MAPKMIMRHGTPGLICGGASTFFLAALYFPIGNGGRSVTRIARGLPRAILGSRNAKTGEHHLNSRDGFGIGVRRSFVPASAGSAGLGVAGLGAPVLRAFRTAGFPANPDCARLLEGGIYKQRVGAGLGLRVQRGVEHVRCVSARGIGGGYGQISGRPLSCGCDLERCFARGDYGVGSGRSEESAGTVNVRGLSGSPCGSGARLLLEAGQRQRAPGIGVLPDGCVDIHLLWCGASLPV